MTPSNQSVEVTHTAVFTTTVSGVGVENFMYQWRHNGTNITGETGDTLMITNVMENDSGDYECSVTNEYGDVATSTLAANLVVYGEKSVKIQQYNTYTLTLNRLLVIQKLWLLLKESHFAVYTQLPYYTSLCFLQNVLCTGVKQFSYEVHMYTE